MGSRRVLYALAAAAVLLGCDTTGASDPPADQAAGDQAAGERVAELEAALAALREQLATRGADAPSPAPPHTLEGLEDALRAYLPGVHEWRPGVTRWRESGLVLPAALVDPAGAASDPGVLTLRLVEAVVDTASFGAAVEPEFGYPWEVTARILRTAEDEALAVVQQWGTGDDSASGTDYRFTLARGAGGWYVTEVSERDQCTRNARLPGEADLPEFCV